MKDPCLDMEMLERELQDGRGELRPEWAEHGARCVDCAEMVQLVRENLLASGQLGPLLQTLRTSTDLLSEPVPPVIPGLSIEQLVARGGQGAVWRGVQESTGRRVAVKTIGDKLHDPIARARFAREARLGAALRHERLVTVLDAGETVSGELFLVMEWVDGKTLAEAQDLAQAPIEQLVRIFIAIAEGIAFAHQRGVLHRDLKPGNIKLVLQDDVRILDFGLAKLVDQLSPDPLVTLPNHFVGTLVTAAPEQLRGAMHAIDARTDLYQLGVVFYRVATGHWPHEPTSDPFQLLDRRMHQAPMRPSEQRAGLGSDMDAVLLKLLEPEPERRYATAHELLRDLECIRAGEPIAARAGERFARLTRTLSRYRWASCAALAVIASLVLSLVVIARAREQAERDRQTIALEYARAEESLGILLRALNSVEAGKDGPKAPISAFLDRLLHELRTGQVQDPRSRAELLQHAALISARLSDPEQSLPYIDQALELLRSEGELASQDELSLRAARAKLAMIGVVHRTELEAEFRALIDLSRAVHGALAPQTLELQAYAAFHRSGTDPKTAFQELEQVIERVAQLEPSTERTRLQGLIDYLFVPVAIGAGETGPGLARARELMAIPRGVTYAERLRRFAVMQNVGPMALDAGDLELADQATREGLELARELALEADPRRAAAEFARGVYELRRGQLDQALPHFEELIRSSERGVAVSPRQLGLSAVMLAQAAADRKDVVRSEAELRRAVKAFAAAGPTALTERAEVELELVRLLAAGGRRAEAQALLSPLAALLGEQLGRGHPLVEQCAELQRALALPP